MYFRKLGCIFLCDSLHLITDQMGEIVFNFRQEMKFVYNQLCMVNVLKF